jgi:hypothetical protein
VLIQALVELDRGGKAGDKGVNGLTETTAPGLVGRLNTHGMLSANAKITQATASGLHGNKIGQH